MVVSVAATDSDTAQPVQYSTFFASRYVRDPLPRLVLSTTTTTSFHLSRQQLLSLLIFHY